MRIQLSQSDLLRMLQTVIEAVPNKSAMPVLSTILLVAEEGSCSVAATDLEISVTTSRPVEVYDAGRATFPARHMFDIVRELPSGELVLSEEGGRVTLASATGQYTMMGFPVNEFPLVPRDIEGAAFALDGELMRRMISKVAFAVSLDQSRPTMGGVNVRANRDGLTMLATDTHRLSWIREAMGVDTDESVQAIVPPRALRVAVSLLRDGNSLERITVGERQIHFAYADAHLFARLIEGPYPDVEAVIPKDNDRVLTVSTADLLPAVRRVHILASEHSHQIRFALQSQELELTTLNRETGAEARERLDVEYGGAPMEVDYNAAYVQEVLAKMDGGRVRLKFRDPESALLIEAEEQPAGETHLCLLMPLKQVSADD